MVVNYAALLSTALQRFGRTVPGHTTAERILDAALAQFEMVGIARSTVEDITRRSGLARVTLYRHFPGKKEITEAVILRELGTFLGDLETAVAHLDNPEDKLAEGFVFTLGALRGHPLLNRLLRTEPDTLLPYLTTEAGSLVDTASTFLAHQLSQDLPDDPRTFAELLIVSELTCRLILSFVLTPSRTIEFADDEAARRFARHHLSPALLGTSTTSEVQS